MSIENLFNREDDALEQARAVLNETGAGPAQLRKGLENLTQAYSRLLKQSKRLITLSDKQQEDLRRLIDENALYLQRLEALSLTDGLTLIPNRRHFNDFLLKEWERAKRSCTPLSLIMLDLDRFKEYNDHYGHSQGDECLKAVAGKLFDVAQRSSDFFARYGGEEFACVLPETDHEGALTVGGRMLEAMVELDIPHAKSGVKPYVTVSLGLATMRLVKGDDPEALIQAADKQLYVAKNQGRDRYSSIEL